MNETVCIVGWRRMGYGPQRTVVGTYTDWPRKDLPEWVQAAMALVEATDPEFFTGVRMLYKVGSMEEDSMDGRRRFTVDEEFERTYKKCTTT